MKQKTVSNLTADQIGETAARAKRFTTAPVQAGDAAGMEPEFVRVPDVQRVWGIKRGTCYGLINSGKIKSVSLRSRGETKGCRLVSVASVRAFIASLEAS